MARFRTFKKKSKLYEPEDDDPAVKATKRTDLAFDIFFDNNEKLYSFYLMSIMTHSFMGLNLDKYTFTDNDFKFLFNTANAMIKHMDKRYKEEVRDMIIKLALPLTSNPSSLLNDFLATYSSKPKDVLVEIPSFPNSKTRVDWGLIDKVRREFATLERVGRVVQSEHLAFLYEILWFYYHDEFSPNYFRHTQIIKEIIIF